MLDQTIYREPGTVNEGASAFLRVSAMPTNRNLIEARSGAENALVAVEGAGGRADAGMDHPEAQRIVGAALEQASIGHAGIDVEFRRRIGPAAQQRDRVRGDLSGGAGVRPHPSAGSPIRHAARRRRGRRARTPPAQRHGSGSARNHQLLTDDRGGIDRPSRSRDIRPLHLTAQEKADLIAFLETLNDDGAEGPAYLPRTTSPAIHHACRAGAARRCAGSAS
jgi:hypothetical protein